MKSQNNSADNDIPQEPLKIALVQADLAWENPLENRNYFSDILKTISDNVDVIVLPEMFTTGFTMNPDKIYETMLGETVLWMKTWANKKQAAITGSIIIKEGNNYYNRLLFVKPNGTVDYYNKRHTFTLAGEDNVYAKGEKKLIVNYKGWRICPLICYDLRFPVWSRNTEDYDLLIYVANWPKKRIKAWDTLLKARAIENMCYCVGVNRIGVDGNNHQYSGHSAVYNVLGKRIDYMPEKNEAAKIIMLSKVHIKTYREKFQFLNDRDRFMVM